MMYSLHPVAPVKGDSLNDHDDGGAIEKNAKTIIARELGRLAGCDCGSPCRECLMDADALLSRLQPGHKLPSGLTVEKPRH